MCTFGRQYLPVLTKLTINQKQHNFAIPVESCNKQSKIHVQVNKTCKKRVLCYKKLYNDSIFSTYIYECTQETNFQLRRRHPGKNQR